MVRKAKAKLYNKKTKFKKHTIKSKRFFSKQKTTKKRNNSKLFSILFLIVNIAIVGGIMINSLTTGETKSLTELFAQKPYYRYLFLALGIQIVFILFESLKFFQLIRTTTKKYRPILAFKVAAIGRYWDCITPFGAGGQPFQIVYLKQNGCKGSASTSIPLAKHMFWQLAFLIIGIFVLVLPFNLYGSGKYIKIVALAGWLGNFLLFMFILLVSINKKIGTKLISGVLLLLCRMKIVKNKEIALQKVLNFVENYQQCIKSFAKSPFQVISQLIYSIVTIILNATVAYCIYLAFNPFGTTSWLEISLMALICEYGMSIIPLPGGSGFAEVSFVAMFSLLFEQGTVFWALLFWRLFTYYYFIIMGFIVIIIDYILKIKKVKTKKEKTKQIDVNDLILYETKK